jgi:hypothetical protein
LADQIQWLHVIIDVASGIAAKSTAFWSSALSWPLGEPWPGHPEFRSFTPPEGDSYIHQQIGDHGPRIHFDLEVVDRGFADRLVELGAVVTGQFEGWCPMRSPGGLPFCLVDRQEHIRPPAVRFEGHRSRLVQICVDSPTSLHDQEVAFWAPRPAGGGVKVTATSSPASCIRRLAPAFSSSSRSSAPMTRRPPCGPILTWAPTISGLPGWLDSAPSGSGPAVAGSCYVTRLGWCSASPAIRPTIRGASAMGFVARQLLERSGNSGRVHRVRGLNRRREVQPGESQ